MSGAIISADQKADAKPFDPVGLANLVVVYLAWGSVYLAIRIGVQEGAGIAPATFVLARILPAAALLLVFSLVRGDRLFPTLGEALRLLCAGLVMWAGANLLVTWAVQRTSSGLAALIFASIPIWVAIMESLLDRCMPSRRISGALMTGFLGIGLLSYPTLRSGTQADLWSVTGLILAAVAWSIGTLIQRRWGTDLTPETSAAWQLLLAAVCLYFIRYLFNEPPPNPSIPALMALGYLSVVATAITFTAYIKSVTLLPTSVAMTYAYVNPVLAVILGALILDEVITIWTIAGAALVLWGVAGVFRERTSEA